MKKVFEINAKEAMNNDYRERHAEERKMQSYFDLDKYRVFVRGYEVGSFYELPFVAFERVNDVYYPYIDCEFKDVNGDYHNYKSLYDGGKVTFYKRENDDAEDAEETKKSHWTYDYRPLKRRYTKEAVEAAEEILKQWNIPVKYTGSGNYRKIENICDAAAAAQNCFVSFPLVCGIENICTRHER